jgi:hypothetical protein
MHLFCRLFDQVATSIPQEPDDIKQSRKVGAVAALLHDLGHGPFSHVAESAFGVDHKTSTMEMIRSAPIADILREDGVDPTDLSRVLEGTAAGDWAILCQLTSSQLDVDRLDYLIRDAYFTGIGFGNVDLERIISTMTLCDRGDLAGQVATLYKGRFSLESYVLSRYLMYQAVYFHKATRSAEALFKSAIKRARSLKDKAELMPELKFLAEDREPTAMEIASLDDNLVYAQLWRWSKSKDDILSQLSGRIVHRNLLKSIDIEDEKFAFMLEEGGEIVKSIANKNHFDPEYLCPYDSWSDTPYTPYSPGAPDDKTNAVTNIFVVDKDGTPDEISKVSDVVLALTHMQHSNRLYCPSEIREDVEKALKQR